MIIGPSKYSAIENQLVDLQSCHELILVDMLNGFSSNLSNPVLDSLVKQNYKNPIHTQYFLNHKFQNKYSSLNISTSISLLDDIIHHHFYDYNQHPPIDIKNFVCSFNGSEHVSRRFLTAALNKFGWFNPDYCSKNLVYAVEKLSGDITKYVGDNDRLYIKFFIGTDSQDFFSTRYSFGHERLNHAKNIVTLQHRITQSFVHLVSETMATSYYPFITEKALYSIVTRGLFLTYGQPHWHEFLETYYGFKKYQKIFDYSFDTISNPVERLISLLGMLSKFACLDRHELYDLYLMEQDTIEYNYDHYFSKSFVNHARDAIR